MDITPRFETMTGGQTVDLQITGTRAGLEPAMLTATDVENLPCVGDFGEKEVHVVQVSFHDENHKAVATFRRRVEGVSSG
jgi:hypothetical protein